MEGQLFSADGVHYRLGGKLGDGATGLVRKAIRTKDEREFAIKFLAPDPKYIEESVFDDVAERFRREGQRGTKLFHSNLVGIHAYGENDGAQKPNGIPPNPYILMELVRGSTLEGYIKREEKRRADNKDSSKTFVPTVETISIGARIAEALQYLHQRKLVHRDVKPANIFLPTGASPADARVAKLGDFGIMKWGDFHGSISTGVLTVTNQQGLGTMKYMSPEQAVAPREVTVRSDLWSLGITLFELFTGQILASPHHVFEILGARMSRGTTASRFLHLGYHIRREDEGIAELILDMHLRGPSGRPAIDRVAGRLKTEWEKRSGRDWQDADSD